MLAPPNAESLLRLWERGEREHPIDRALSMLAVFCDKPARELARLDVGRRDALLFKSRALLFGSEIEGFAACGRCGCAIAVSMTAPETAATEAGAPDDEDAWYSLGQNERAVEYRLPTSLDLAAIARCDSVETARRRLLERCVRGADDADDAVLAGAVREIARRVEPASLDVALDCPECGHAWSLDFDIASFFWEEVRARARRLLREVDALARRYGWGERDILALSDTRRRHYLELAS
jgi:hypothetical protein